MPNSKLAQVFEEETGLSLSTRGKRLVNKFAWSAIGRGFVKRDETTEVWTVGDDAPDGKSLFGGHSFTDLIGLANRVTQTSPEQFEEMVDELYNGARAPRVAASIIGSAIKAAEAGRSA
ncbi:MAG: hypothetical protein NTY57_08350 [Solirubrobacterales bacterium]|nr:hypothetical protein [Solirubrobacterales bacterium]